MPNALQDPAPLADGAGLTVFVLVGLLGGAHCLGMCGPLVTLYAERMESDGPVSWNEVRQHLLFNLGRTSTYALLGALMGGIGSLVYETAAVAAVANDVRAVGGLVVGVFIVFTGVSYVLTGKTTGAMGHGLAPSVFERASAVAVARVDTWVRGPRIVGLGAIHGFLPCPLLYPAFLYALAAGSPGYGAVALGVLGVATVPAVFAYGVAFQSVSTHVRGPLHRALGVAFLLLGYLPIAHGLMLFGISVPHPTIPVYQPLG